MVGNNAVRDSEAHAGAFSHLFGGEEGFKNAFLYFRRDPMTTIMHDNAYIATGMTRMQGGGVWPQGDSLQAHVQEATGLPHGILSICTQVHQDLMHLRRIDHDWPNLFVEMLLDNDRRGQ